MSITETRTLPPEFIEAAQRTYLTDLATQLGMPSVTTAAAKQPGETDAQFAQRQAQAQQFNITRAGMAELAPQVAAQDPLQAAAYQQAVDPTKGLGSFQPFLTKSRHSCRCSNCTDRNRCRYRCRINTIVHVTISTTSY